MYPTSIPTQNTYRLVHLFPESRSTDFNRLEDLAADATKHARAALSLQDGLFTEAHNTLAKDMARLTGAVSARRLLTDDARGALEAIVAHCDRLLAEHGDDTVVEALQLQAQAALDASHRVADLLAAEDSIGHFRGIPTARGR